MCIDQLKLEGCSILLVQRPRKHDFQTSDLYESQQKLLCMIRPITQAYRLQLKSSGRESVI